MKKTRRVLLGILLGAAAGAALTAGVIFVLPENVSLHSVHSEPFVFFLQFVFHDLSLNPDHFLVGCGAVVGVVAGVSWARVIPNQKKWFSILIAFVAGVVGGGIAVYLSSEKWVENVSALGEHTSETERVGGILYGLISIDRATTNQFYLTNFQQTGHMIVTNYIYEADNWKNEFYGFSFTNLLIYKQAQKYIAAHPDPIRMQHSSNIQTNSPPP